MILLLRFPLKGEYKSFSLFSLLTTLMILCTEFLLYLWSGNNYINEKIYYGYLIFYTASIVIYKIWNGLR